MSSRSPSPVRAAAGAAAVAVLAVFAPVQPAAAGEEGCVHTRGDGSCALALTGVPEGFEPRVDGQWLEVPGRDPDCRTGDGAPVGTLPGDDGVFRLLTGTETVHCDVAAVDGEAVERTGSGQDHPFRPTGPSEPAGTAADGVGDGGDTGPAEPAADPEPAAPPGAAKSDEPAEPAGDGDAPGAVGREEHDGAPGGTGAQEPDPVPSAPPSPEQGCLGGAEGRDGTREGQRSSAERTGTCRGTSFARWPDPGAAAEQAAQLAFIDLADRLGVSVFDLAERVGADGVRGLSRRSVDELAAVIGISPQELVERAEQESAALLAEEAAAASLAEQVSAALPAGEAPTVLSRRGGLFGKPARLPETGPRAAVLVHGGVLLTAAGALALLLSRRRIPS